MKNILLQIDETQIVHNTSKWFDFFEAKALEYGPKILMAVVIYLVGRWLIKWAVKLITKFFSYRKFDDTLKSFLLSMVKVGLTVLLFLTIAGQIGIPITGFAAILGGLAIGVGAALNGSLGNLAGGVMLMIFKPFKVGDIITAQGMTGVVTEIGIVNTVLRTPENKTVFLPNGALSTGVITNFNEYGNLKVSIELAIDASQDIEKARRVGIEVMQSFPEVMQDPKPSVAVSKIEGGAIYLGFAPYATQGDYWKVYWGVLEKLKVEFDKNDIKLPIASMVVKNA